MKVKKCFDLEGKGGVLKKNSTGRLRPVVRPVFPLYIIFGRKDTPFAYLPLTNGTSFVYFPLAISAPFLDKAGHSSCTNRRCRQDEVNYKDESVTSCQKFTKHTDKLMRTQRV